VRGEGVRGEGVRGDDGLDATFARPSGLRPRGDDDFDERGDSGEGSREDDDPCEDRDPRNCVRDSRSRAAIGAASKNDAGSAAGVLPGVPPGVLPGWPSSKAGMSVNPISLALGSSGEYSKCSRLARGDRGLLGVDGSVLRLDGVP
jgi:hypothetical protein